MQYHTWFTSDLSTHFTDTMRKSISCLNVEGKLGFVDSQAGFSEMATNEPDKAFLVIFKIMQITCLPSWNIHNFNATDF